MFSNNSGPVITCNKDDDIWTIFRWLAWRLHECESSFWLYMQFEILDSRNTSCYYALAGNVKYFQFLVTNVVAFSSRGWKYSLCLQIRKVPNDKIPAHFTVLTMPPTDGPYFSRNVSSNGNSGTFWNVISYTPVLGCIYTKGKRKRKISSIIEFSLENPLEGNVAFVMKTHFMVFYPSEVFVFHHYVIFGRKINKSAPYLLAHQARSVTQVFFHVHAIPLWQPAPQLLLLHPYNLAIWWQFPFRQSKYCLLACGFLWNSK